ncbi:MAG: DoxX family protein [Prevotellaceae bacterium]|nr:DoxX family protein [Prevotellaceae bacterium]
MKYQKLFLIIRLFAGIVFLLSGIAKAIDTTGFGKLIVQYGFENFQFLAPIIIFAEIAAGICLLLSIYTKQVSLLSLLMVAVFTIVYAYSFFSGKVEDCGCFGKITMLQMSPLVTFIRNGLLLCILFFVWRYAQNATISRLKLLTIASLLIASAFIIGFNLDWKKVKRPSIHPLYQRAVKETILPQLTQLSPDSTYLVYIFAYRCESCWDTFENIKRYEEEAIADRLVVFAAGEDKNNEFKNYFQPDFPIQETDEQTLSNLIRVTPTLLYIQKDSIRHIIQGSLPTTYFFRKNYLNSN